MSPALATLRPWRCGFQFRHCSSEHPECSAVPTAEQVLPTASRIAVLRGAAGPTSQRQVSSTDEHGVVGSKDIDLAAGGRHRVPRRGRRQNCTTAATVAPQVPVALEQVALLCGIYSAENTNAPAGGRTYTVCATYVAEQITRGIARPFNVQWRKAWTKNALMF